MSFVNSPLMDYENRFSNKVSNVSILYYDGYHLRKTDLRKFIHVIHENFENEVYDNNLNHNRKNIARLLTSNNAITIIAYDVDKKKILAYLIAENTIYDKNNYLHINYLFVSPDNRMKGLGTKMLNLIKKYGMDNKKKTLSLNYNVNNLRLKKFYYSNGFVPYDKNNLNLLIFNLQ